jgi:hypothetical protein
MHISNIRHDSEAVAFNHHFYKWMFTYDTYNLVEYIYRIIKLLTSVVYACDLIWIMQSKGQDYHSQYVQIIRSSHWYFVHTQWNKIAFLNPFIWHAFAWR